MAKRGDKKRRAIEAIEKYQDQLESGELSFRQLSEEIDVNACYISTLAIELGVNSFYKDPKNRGRRKKKVVTEENLDKILDYVMKHGGYASQAIKALGLPFQSYKQRIFDYAKEKGVDLSHWRYAHKQFGLWYILPGKFEDCYVCDKRLDAVCMGCGEVHEVLLVNLRSGVSKGCMNCRKSTFNIKVKCVETGELYKSIRAFSDKIGRGKNYQMIRRALITQKHFEHDGKTYQIIRDTRDVRDK